MPKFSTSVSHALGTAKAKDLLRSYMEKAKEMAPDKFSTLQTDFAQWDAAHQVGFSLSISGIAIKGVMAVSDDKIAVDGDIPFAAMLFKGKIEEGFRDMVGKVVTPA